MPWNAIINSATEPLIILLLIAIAILSKLYFIHQTRAHERRTMKSEELKIFHEILSNKKIDDREFLIEQLMELKYGRAISWREIKYLMSLTSPSEALSCFMETNLCTSFPIKNDKPSYNGLFKHDYYRNMRKWVNAAWYFISAVGFFALIFLALKIMIAGNMNDGLSIIAFAFVIFISSIFALRGYVIIKKAERLMELIDYSDRFTHKNIN